MPQMNPMNWCIIMIMVFIVYILNYSKIFWEMKKDMKMFVLEKTKNSFYYKW